MQLRGRENLKGAAPDRHRWQLRGAPEDSQGLIDLVAVLDVEEVVEHLHRGDRIRLVVGGQQQGCAVEVHDVDLLAAKELRCHLPLGLVDPAGLDAANPLRRDRPPATAVALDGLERCEVHQLVVTQPEPGVG